MAKVRHWCYFRCLVQAAYREARHIGPPGDQGANCVATGEFSMAAELCSRNRTVLKTLDLWKRTDRAGSTDDVLEPYLAHTGLRPEELPAVFRLPGWRPGYGGEPWARIAEVLVKLRDAIDERNEAEAERLCDVAASLRHNSGTLVPSEHRWRADRWQQEKWPELCD